LWGAPIGQDGIAIITHPTNPVTKLSIEQLRAVYQGLISDWSILGGSPGPITVISREAGSGTRAEFERLLMGERQTTQSAQIAPSSAAVIASVGREPGSIGYVSMSYLDASVQALAIENIAPIQANVQQNTYPLRMTLFFAGPAEPVAALRFFIAWVQSPEGQAVVAQRYTPLLSP
jgi:phosphate transport system substrate-binding protein